MCVSADGFNCKTIDYCPETKKCLLHSENAKQPSTSSQTDLCYNYKSMWRQTCFFIYIYQLINKKQKKGTIFLHQVYKQTINQC